MQRWFQRIEASIDSYHQESIEPELLTRERALNCQCSEPLHSALNCSISNAYLQPALPDFVSTLPFVTIYSKTAVLPYLTWIQI